MPEAISDVFARRLAVHLGPNVARTAVKAFAQKALSKKPEDLTVAQVPQLIEALRPMLVVMIGKDPSQIVLEQIARDCR